MKDALRHLLDTLDTIGKTHGEIEDTDVREQSADAIHHGFIAATPGYTLPEKIGMFEPDGNRQVREALTQFLADPAVAHARETLTPAQRLDAFQAIEVQSAEGATFDDYFGYRQSL